MNALARQGLSVSLADPVGLYIAEANLGAFEGPNGEDVSAAWRVTRGIADRQLILRATFAVAESLGFTVDEVLASGEPIQFGGQVADAIQMTLTGIAKDRGQGAGALQGCVAQCCEHPQRSGIETVVDRTDDCASFPWEVLEPFAEPAEPEPSPASLVAGAEDVEVDVAPGPAYSRLETTR